MVSYVQLWSSIFILGQLCSTLGNHGQPKSIILNHVNLWSTTEIYGQPCSTLLNRTLTWSTMANHGPL